MTKKPARLKRRFLLTTSGFSLIYLLFCLVLFACQRQLIYRPLAEQSMQPSSSEFGLSYQNVWIPLDGTTEKLHGWWLSADETVSILPNEPQQILSSPRTILYFCGVGRNMGDYNYLSRVAAFRQLGFSVLVFDYRGYGQSKGKFPHEQQLYAAAQPPKQQLIIPDVEHVSIYSSGEYSYLKAIQQFEEML